MIWLIRSVRQILKGEEGNIETGLVMIPLMILFLSVLQLPVSSLARVAYSSKLQSDTYVQGFVPTSQSATNQYIYANPQSRSIEGPVELLPMPGGGELVVKSRRVFGPQISPLLITGDQFNSIGITVNENK